MNKIYEIYQYENQELLQESSNPFQQVEDIVEMIIKEGIKDNSDLYSLASKVAREYDITSSEAQSCVRLAAKQLDYNVDQDDNDLKDRYANCGYYYPKTQTCKDYHTNTSKNDGMDTLSAYGNYKKLMFGLN